MVSKSYEAVLNEIEYECGEFLDRLTQSEEIFLHEKLTYYTQNGLEISYRENFLLLELLDSLYKLFSRQDNRFASKSLQRGYEEMELIWRRYGNYIQTKRNKHRLFEDFFTHFLTASAILGEQKNRLKVRRNLSDEMREKTQRLEGELQELKQIAYKIFVSRFQESDFAIRSSFKLLLNTFVYYFEIALWEEAKRSKKIVSLLRQAGVKKLNTKGYLEYKIFVALPNEEIVQLKQIYEAYKWE